MRMGVVDCVPMIVRVGGLQMCGLWCLVSVWYAGKGSTYLRRGACIRGVVCGYGVGMVGDVGLKCGV